MVDYTAISVEREDGLAVITLQRPERLNALIDILLQELAHALDDLRADSGVRALAITGSGRAFCAGQDLDSIGQTPIDVHLRRLYHPVILGLADFPGPVVAAVNGVAAGAGFSLAAACDIRIASEQARFVPAFAAVGMVPDSGLTYFLPRLVGYGRALGRCLSGEPITAHEAVDMGLVNQVIPDEDFATTWRAEAGALAQGPLSLAYTKALLQGGLDRTLREQLEEEARHQGLAAASADGREGVRAFREKRRPRFRGSG